MIAFKILTQSHQSKLYEKIKEASMMKKLEEKMWTTQEEEDTTIFEFSASKRERESMLETIANIVSDTVQEEVLDKFATKYLKERKDIIKEDKEAIKELFIISNYMSKEEGVSYISYYMLYLPILKELEKYQQINIEGWIAFRMQSYHNVLNEVIEQTIYDFQTQKEYIEYIRFIISIKREQEGSEETMHLIPKAKGAMGLLDSKKEDVTKAYIYQYCEEFLEDGSMKLEDLLLNILISAPPKEFVIHQKEVYKNQQFITTLETIFSGHVQYCVGCEACGRRKED